MLIKRGLALTGHELLELVVFTVCFLLDGVEDKTVLLDGKVVIVNFVFYCFFEFLYFLVFESKVKVGNAHCES